MVHATPTRRGERPAIISGEEFCKRDALRRASSYLSLGQTHVLDNRLLRKAQKFNERYSPLGKEDAPAMEPCQRARAIKRPCLKRFLDVKLLDAASLAGAV